MYELRSAVWKIVQCRWEDETHTKEDKSKQEKAITKKIFLKVSGVEEI